jgi:hypothetical protein
MARHLLRPAARAAMRQHKGQIAAITYLLRDEFTTDRAAGAVNGTAAEPGPGTRTVVDSGGNMSIASGQIQVAAAVGGGDPGLVYADVPVARAAGVALIASIDHTNHRVAVGFNTDTTPTATGEYSAVYSDYAGGPPALYAGGAYVPGGSLGTTTVGKTYLVSLVLRSTGVYALIKSTEDALYPEWTLLWVANEGNAATLYAFWGVRALALDPMQFVRVAQLAAPWNASDTGIATQVLAGARSAGDTFTHEANALIEFTVGAVSASQSIYLDFRKQDDNNKWSIQVNQLGNLNLLEVVGGTATGRGNAAGVIAAGDRIVVVAEGQTIKVYEANTLRITYTSATNFQTQTSGELDARPADAAVSDIISWPRVLSGTALTELERYTA